MTKQQVVNKVRDLEEDNKALWHWCKCLEESYNKLYKQVNGVYPYEAKGTGNEEKGKGTT